MTNTHPNALFDFAGLLLSYFLVVYAFSIHQT